METITLHKLYRLGRRVRPEKIYHVATLTYIQNLIRPFAEIVSGKITVRDISDWITMTIPGALGEQADRELIKAVAKEIIREDPNKIQVRYLPSTTAKPTPNDMNIILGQTDAKILSLAVNQFIEYIASECLYLSVTAASIYDDTILPWDLQQAIQEDEELGVMFNMTEKSTTLPVQIKVGNQTVIHELTVEITYGIILFIRVTNPNFIVTMFGVQLSPDELNAEKFKLRDDEEENELTVKPHVTRFNTKVKLYSATISGVEYNFSTPDFIRGFMSAAAWAKINYQPYITDIRDNKKQVSVKILV